MKTCKCGFSYNDRNDLERVNLAASKGVVKYYCPDCKGYKYTEKVKFDEIRTQTVTFKNA